MNKKRILVTGGMGYIGSHTCVELMQKGYDVTIVDNLYNAQESVADAIATIVGEKPDFEKVDCCCESAMRGVFAKYSFDAVIHFAAYKAVGESVDKPLEYYQNNLGSLITVLQLANEFGVKGFVFSSSCTVYGQPDVLPASEATPKKMAESPYGRTKQMCEDIIEDFAKISKGLKSIALRYFNPIGAHPSLLIGERPNGIPNNLLPYITQTAAGIRECLGVFGDDYNTPDGSCIRDYIDVTDLAKAHVAAVDRLLNHTDSAMLEYYNVGTGNGVSVLEIIKTFEEANNLKLNYKIMPRRQGDIEAVWADPTLVNEKLGWKAEVALIDTLRNAWNWEKSL